MMTSNSFVTTPGTVYFIGAGPGAPDLITVRGQEIIAQADLILYADSLVEESVAGLTRRAEARIVGSSSLHLGQILDLMVETARAGGVVARIHSGDPALYGAIHEQMAHLEDQAIPYEIVPGVTAAFAAAARLNIELTIPDVVQTIILTRTAGRTSMPAGEDLRTLAAPGASLAIYLSISRIRHVVDDLLASGGYQPDTPVVVFHKVTWPDESYVEGTLADIAEKVRAAGYTKHALILISPALDPTLKGENRRTSSHLYDKSYTHRFRRAEGFKRRKERQEAQGLVRDIVVGEKHLGSTASQNGTAVIALTRRGSQLAARLAIPLEADLAIPAKFAGILGDWPNLAQNQETFSGKGNNPKNLTPNPSPKLGEGSQLSPQPLPSPTLYADSALAEVRRRWSQYQRLVLVMPAGVAVRAIAPVLGHKNTDPAVICLDEAGRSVIPLLGGHRAGANELATQIALITGGQAAITTASDVQGKPALDLPPLVSAVEAANQARWPIDPDSALTHASACLVNDELVGVYLDPALSSVQAQVEAWLAPADQLIWVDSLDDLDSDTYTAGLIISHRLLDDHHRHLLRKSVLYRPPVLVAGLGCKRGVPVEELRSALETTLADNRLALASLASLATADLKADEPGLSELARDLDLPLQIIAGEQLAALAPSGFTPSAAQEKFNLPGVAEPCALLASGPEGQVIVPKRSFERCTVAVGLKKG